MRKQYGEVKRLYASGVSGNEIAKKFGLNPRTLYFYLAKDGLTRSSTEIPFTPHFTEDLGYVIGALLGDGCFTEKAHYMMRLRVKDYDFVEQFATSFAKVLNRKFKIDKEGIVFKVQVYRKQFFLWLKNSDLSQILTENRNMLRGFLRGFFDAEGSITYDKYDGCWLLRFDNSNQELIKLCSNLLFNLGIGAWKKRPYATIKYSSGGKGFFPGGQIRNSCIMYRLQISSQISIRKFREIVGSSIERKRGRLFLV